MKLEQKNLNDLQGRGGKGEEKEGPGGTAARAGHGQSRWRGVQQERPNRERAATAAAELRSKFSVEVMARFYQVVLIVYAYEVYECATATAITNCCFFRRSFDEAGC